MHINVENQAQILVGDTGPEPIAIGVGWINCDYENNIAENIL